jgi:hypothetical protein
VKTSLRDPVRGPLRGASDRISDETKHAVRRALPSWAWYAFMRASGYLPTPIDDSPLELIEREDPARLTDGDHLAREVLPRMGLNGTSPELFPLSLAPYLGRGTHHFQLPIQFGPYLAEAARRDVASYLEIGVEHGGTFAITVEVMRRLQPMRTAIAVDLGPIPRLLARYRRRRPEVEFAAVNSGSEDFRRLLRERGPFDLVLIDGDHSEEGCRRDFEAVRGHARMVAFHDLNEPHYPGVRAVWESVPEAGYEKLEFTAQYDELMDTVGPRFGIGLAIRRT